MTTCSVIDRAACVVTLVAGLLCLPQISLAQDAISAPAQKQIGAAKTEMVPSLIVMNSRGASLRGNTLTLNGVSSNSIVFADRPVRMTLPKIRPTLPCQF
jgi:hypothetical protein